ncbi:Bug family tripartite tricarboxylate transporter substrate binding protein [Rhodoplanes sp. Z2-YC6860]|uniref:Bug family tripartite tricarboxylate transporter substrate binding protein n=1 Tax=Rhodoplanes sp. Z2-YC6860 TaxID=674703 RepID=UPI00078C7F49|nr:tripartite tricarboxylate transporter substrate binding protein [Rhodoplanes sp. Z2-YC6860]AMN38614.1 extra-cytoplasmic solute receptor BugT [Rhodoplanes sp. Z2-YC6860]
MRKLALSLLALALTLPLAASMARADDYPNKPIKIIVPYAAGGGTDIVARIVALKLQEKWGQAAVVENRAGAGGNVGAEVVFNAPPDGYTLLFTAQGPLVVNQYLFDKIPYEPEKFTPISLVMVAYSALLANPKLPAKDLKELIAYAKANPGKLNYASQGIGTAAHLIAELFKSMAGVQINHVPYRGSGPALNDLVAGHVDLMFGELAPSYQYIQSGQLRALAVSSETRIANLPDVPAVTEVVPGFKVTSWWCMVGPPNMPADLTSKISSAVGEVMREAEVKDRLSGMSMVSTGSSPAELSKFIDEEAKRWGDVIRTSGAKAQ